MVGVRPENNGPTIDESCLLNDEFLLGSRECQDACAMCMFITCMWPHSPTSSIMTVRGEKNFGNR